ncbi:MAG: DUF1109 family protein [Deltaproteobacteria bacterium]|nr:DUF1109 family protein [Deltaproteobacteria bacterium]
MTDCDRLSLALEEKRDPEQALRNHASTCRECATVYVLDLQLRQVPGTPSEPSEALRRAVEEAVRVPSRGLRVARSVALPAALSVLLVGLVLGLKPRADLSEQAGARYWAILVAWELALVAALVGALARGPHGVGVLPRWRWALALGALGLFQGVAWTLTVATEHSARALPSGASHLVCTGAGLGVAALVGLAVGRAVRGTAVVSPGASAALSGVASGMAGVAVLHGFCEVATPAHQALSHGAVLALALGLGLAVRRRLEP